MPEASAAADAPEAGLTLDRAGLAERAGVPAFVVDLIIDAGLLASLENGHDGERFGSADVDMLVAARNLMDEGVAVEELAALAMRHATNVEELIEDAIDLLKRHAVRSRGNHAALVATVQRLVPVATQLVVGHFERTLWARAMARIGGDPGPAAGAIVVRAVRLAERVDPLAAYAAAGDHAQRSVWLRPDAGLGLAAIGVVETIEPVGPDRFSAASAARAVLAARIKRHGPDQAPAPVLVGGFSFTPDDSGRGRAGDTRAEHRGSTPGGGNGHGVSTDGPGGSRDGHGGSADGSGGSREGHDAERRGPAWDGFGDCRLVLPELTVIDRADGTWVQAATRVGPDSDEAAAHAHLEQRLASFAAESLPAPLIATHASVHAIPPDPGDDASLGGRGDDGGNAGRGLDASLDGRGDGAGNADPGDDASLGGRGDDASLGGRGDDGGNAGRPVAGLGCDQDDDYLALVSSAVAAIERGEFQKVVLARTVTVHTEVEPTAVLDRLRRRNPNCAAFAFTVGDRTFLGATPEELVTLDGPHLHTTALAGTAPRGHSPGADQRLAAGLMASAKNRSEHRFVVDGITEALAGLGLVDPAPAEPGLLRLSRLQHLRTPITARVQRRRSGVSDMDVLRAAGVLHPTAAVGGAPTEAALGFIARREGLDRGWYAAPVGWCDLDGNGEIGVALRSALTEPGRAHLFAGAGIVADSVPAEELEETTVKLQALLDVIRELADRGSSQDQGLRDGLALSAPRAARA